MKRLSEYVHLLPVSKQIKKLANSKSEFLFSYPVNNANNKDAWTMNAITIFEYSVDHAF